MLIVVTTGCWFIFILFYPFIIHFFLLILIFPNARSSLIILHKPFVPLVLALPLPANRSQIAHAWRPLLKIPKMAATVFIRPVRWFTLLGSDLFHLFVFGNTNWHTASLCRYCSFFSLLKCFPSVHNDLMCQGHLPLNHHPFVDIPKYRPPLFFSCETFDGVFDDFTGWNRYAWLARNQGKISSP